MVQRVTTKFPQKKAERLENRDTPLKARVGLLNQLQELFNLKPRVFERLGSSPQFTLSTIVPQDEADSYRPTRGDMEQLN